MKTIIAGIFQRYSFALPLPGVFFLIGYWIVKAGKRAIQRENEYEKLYSEITKMIDNNLAAINEANYDFIMDKLIKLGRLKHKDREKTTVLNIKFIRKYSTFFERQKVKV